MKRIFNYILPLLTLVIAASCSETICGTDSTEGEGTGTLSMRITATRAEADVYDPMDHLVVSIYNKDGGLLRRYRSKESLPARLELLAGDYRVEVTAGEEKPASFTQRLYTGEKTFTVTAGAVTPVEVRCNIQNVVAEAKFDKSIGSSFGTDFYAWIVASDTFVEADAVQNKVPALKYTTNAKGYFTIPAGVTSLAWYFKGEHPDPKYGTIVKQSVLTEIKTPGKYVLTFKFSPDLPGYIEAIPIRVDTSTDDEDDTIIFSPDPILEGVGFDAEAIQRYTAGEKSYTVAAMEQIDAASIEIDGVSYDLLSATPLDNITVEKTTATDLKITLSDAFLTGRSAGDHALKFHITDTAGGELLAETVYRFEGLLPVTNDHCDLWNNSVVLRYVAFGDSVSFSLREKDGEWHTIAGEKKDNDIFVGTFTAEWTKSTNAANLEVYTQAAGTGVRAAHTYEYKATVAGVESTVADFTTAGGDIIPGGNMEDSSMKCFKVEESNPSPFWASGNNSFAKALCSWSSFGSNPENHSAKLQSVYATVVLAAGNLLSGYFYKADLTTGVVEFGQPYTWTARPKALRVKYAAKIGNVNRVKHPGAPIGDKDQDLARIFACVVNWNGRHVVKSGTSAPSGVWDPTTTTATSEGKIIGYASKFITDTALPEEMIEIEIPFEYYDTTAKPTGAINVIISCSGNAYGDFMTGCDSNTMYVDDFKWVY